MLSVASLWCVEIVLRMCPSSIWAVEDCLQQRFGNQKGERGSVLACAGQ